MAIFNKKYIKNYNILNEGLIFSIFIKSIIAIITPIIALYTIIAVENRKEKDFNKLLEKYPLIKKYIIELIEKCQDALLKMTKLNYVEYIPNKVFLKDGRMKAINRSNTKIDEKNNKAEWKYDILYMDAIKFIKSSPKEFKKYIIFEDGDFYLDYSYYQDISNDKEKYDRLEKIRKDLVQKINEDIKSMELSINKLNNELENQPNGNIVKLSSYTDIDDKELEELQFPRNYVNLSINMNNIKETDDIKKLISEFKEKYFL